MFTVMKVVKKNSLKILKDMEILRRELYSAVNGRQELLNTREICEVSSRLDKLIVKHMCSDKNCNEMQA